MSVRRALGRSGSSRAARPRRTRGEAAPATLGAMLTSAAVFALATLPSIITATTVFTVNVAPSDCGDVGSGAAGGGDCYSAIATAVSKCRDRGPAAGGCAIVLAPGSYTVGCPDAPRPSSTQTEFPAVSLGDLVGPVSFGGAADPRLPRPQLLIDYTHGGCAAVVAANSSDVTVQHLTIDALRLPFTVGTLVEDSTPTVVKIRPEESGGGGRQGGPADRSGVYAWDPQRWPWVERFLTTQAVPAGARATRELPSLGMTDNDGNQHSSSLSDDGVLTIEFLDNRSLASLRKGERIFLKHFGNMQSWGVHGRNVSGMALTNVTLWSVSGMGYRCDLCLGRYSLTDSDIAIKPGTDRPMSITADAVHFMHHAGHIELRRSSFEGGGDDGFNVRIISGPSAL
jgi:hypothetical protein